MTSERSIDTVPTSHSPLPSSLCCKSANLDLHDPFHLVLERKADQDPYRTCLDPVMTHGVEACTTEYGVDEWGRGHLANLDVSS